MKRRWTISAIVVLTLASVWLNWPHNDLPTAPQAMTADEIRATQDTQVITLATTDLRWKLAEVSPDKRTRWRAWPKAAQHVFVLAWTESDNGPGAPSVFDGFAALLARSGPNIPTLPEIAEAYTAIGAPTIAAIVDEAHATANMAGIIPGNPIERPADFAAFDSKFHHESTTCKAVVLLRAYIREHADDIAAAHIPH